jgi:hypothetical protein
MKGFSFINAVFIVAALAAPALGDSLIVSVDANLTMTQNAYSDNWVGGEAGAISWTFNSNSLVEKQLADWVHMKNTLKLFFGQTHNQDIETKDWDKPVKSTDLIDFESVYRFTIGAFVDPFAAGRIETQFLDASDPEKDRYINPVKITESFGVAKVLIKEEKREWSVRFGGGFRQYIDRDVLVDPVAMKRDTETSNDFGMTFDSDFKTPLAGEAIIYTSKLTVFNAFFYSKEDELEGQPDADYWKSPDVNWENIFTASITKYLMVNLYIQLLYDKEIDKAGRFKQTLSLGFTYKLI